MSVVDGIVQMRNEHHRRTGDLPKYLYLGYREYDDLMIHYGGYVHYEYRMDNEYCLGMTVIRVNKLNHIRVGV